MEGCDGVFEFRQYVLIDVFIGAFGVTLRIKKQGTIGSLLFYADVDQLIFVHLFASSFQRVFHQ